MDRGRAYFLLPIKIYGVSLLEGEGEGVAGLLFGENPKNAKKQRIEQAIPF